MKTVSEIYTEYKLLPILQLHQLRVAAVGKKLAESLTEPVDVRAVILACLFHDMGNIIKFDLEQFPESREPEGVVYWEKVKADFIRRYGPDEHHATVAIGHELHLPLQAMQYIEGVGFSKLERTRDSHSYGQKVVEYADCCVAPYGITSMDERFKETRLRYAKRRSDLPGDDARYNELVAAGEEIKRQIFEKAKIGPEEITEAALHTSVEELRTYLI